MATKILFLWLDKKEKKMEFKIFLKHLNLLTEECEQWNMDERDDGIIMHTDALDDFKWWLEDKGKIS